MCKIIPKVLLCSKGYVDQLGIEETIEFLNKYFGYKMKLKNITDSQYLFEEDCTSLIEKLKGISKMECKNCDNGGYCKRVDKIICYKDCEKPCKPCVCWDKECKIFIK